MYLYKSGMVYDVIQTFVGNLIPNPFLSKNSSHAI